MEIEAQWLLQVKKHIKCLESFDNNAGEDIEDQVAFLRHHWIVPAACTKILPRGVIPLRPLASAI